MPVTMQDVAERAGVSIRTVSRVVNKSEELSEETRQRVQAAIKQLGYRPSRLARALVTQHSDTIGLLIPDITNPFFSEVARGVVDAAESEGYSVFLANTDSNADKEFRALQKLADHAVDGAILFPTPGREATLCAFAAEYGPIVAINDYGLEEQHPSITCILTSLEEGARMAVDRLVSGGHRAIAMLSDVYEPDLLPRVRGYRDALRAHRLPVRDDWICRGPPVIETGCRSTLRLLQAFPEITGIFAYNDLLAIGAMRACKELSRPIPEACGIVGFDDIHLASLITPPLTTIHIDKYQLGREAFDRLLDMLERPGAPHPTVKMKVSLMERESA
ncbi:MAG: LacI family DNA-binding transcriptional regulator [Anaerolineae bacterium]